MTREEWYQERIAHLRTGVAMLRDDFNALRKQIGMPPVTSPDVLLSGDIGRSVKQDAEPPILEGKALWQLVFEAAGAATAPLMADHPDYVFPDGRVADGVRAVMADHGFTDPPEGYRP